MNSKQKKFEAIYDQFVEKIYRFVCVKVNSNEIAEDLTSDTFLRCWQVYKNDQNAIDNVQAFLYKIANNLIIDHYRTKGRMKTVSADAYPISDPRINIVKTAENNLDIGNIKTVLAGLDNSDYQNVVIWHYVDDLSVPEIAEIMEKTEENVRVMLHRALKAVKNKIEEV